VSEWQIWRGGEPSERLKIRKSYGIIKHNIPRPSIFNGISAAAAAEVKSFMMFIISCFSFSRILASDDSLLVAPVSLELLRWLRRRCTGDPGGGGVPKRALLL
jgi:hypothetical protein